MTGRVDREVGGVFDELLRGGSSGELDVPDVRALGQILSVDVTSWRDNAKADEPASDLARDLDYTSVYPWRLPDEGHQGRQGTGCGASLSAAPSSGPLVERPADHRRYVLADSVLGSDSPALQGICSLSLITGVIAGTAPALLDGGSLFCGGRDGGRPAHRRDSPLRCL